MGLAYLRWLGRTVYGTFLPLESAYLSGAENYLSDVWTVAPKRVALLHTLLATFFLFIPGIILRKFKLIFQLSQDDRELFQIKMIGSRSYLLRTMIYGIRGHALVAILRDPNAREHALTLESTHDTKQKVG
jgi:hypothetical protein